MLGLSHNTASVEVGTSLTASAPRHSPTASWARPEAQPAIVALFAPLRVAIATKKREAHAARSARRAGRKTLPGPSQSPLRARRAGAVARRADLPCAPLEGLGRVGAVRRSG